MVAAILQLLINMNRQLEILCHPKHRLSGLIFRYFVAVKLACSAQKLIEINSKQLKLARLLLLLTGNDHAD